MCILSHTQPFNGPFSRITQVSRYQKGKTNQDFTGARDSEWQWHQLGHMQVCTSLQTDNHASTPPLSFLEAVCPSCRPTNSVKALCILSINRISTLLQDTIKQCKKMPYIHSSDQSYHYDSLNFITNVHLNKLKIIMIFLCIFASEHTVRISSSLRQQTQVLH